MKSLTSVHQNHSDGLVLRVVKMRDVAADAALLSWRGHAPQQGGQVADRDFVDVLGRGRQFRPERPVDPAVGQPIELGPDLIPRHGRDPEAIEATPRAFDPLPPSSSMEMEAGIWGPRRRLKSSLGAAVTLFVRLWTSSRSIRSVVNCGGQISPSSSATDSSQSFTSSRSSVDEGGTVTRVSLIRPRPAGSSGTFSNTICSSAGTTTRCSEGIT